MWESGWVRFDSSYSVSHNFFHTNIYLYHIRCGRETGSYKHFCLCHSIIYKKEGNSPNTIREDEEEDNYGHF